MYRSPLPEVQEGLLQFTYLFLLLLDITWQLFQGFQKVYSSRFGILSHYALIVCVLDIAFALQQKTIDL